MPDPVLASCHCGAVEIRVAAAIDAVTDCNCSICRRYGVLWAYFSPHEVVVSTKSPTETYSWGERSQAFHRCATCGCVTHWAKFSPDADKIGINARLFPPHVLRGARVRRLDGAVTDRYLDE